MQSCNVPIKNRVNRVPGQKKQDFTAITSLSTNQYQQKLTIGKKMWVINGAMKYNKVKCFFYLFDFKFSRGPYCPSSLPSNWSHISNAWSGVISSWRIVGSNSFFLHSYNRFISSTSSVESCCRCPNLSRGYILEIIVGSPFLEKA